MIQEALISFIALSVSCTGSCALVEITSRYQQTSSKQNP